ncbi:Poly(ribitol-phosphate) beta-N-acetylglucosaminyltransferase TarS [Methanosarcinales archaeon]|nr:TIGR04283 family arsenosugar biosynthesis glycosyltransferase [Candidatus Methanoperedens sp.]CAG0972309.1 Poly(ribitol-phosphate) beta-N-acetylglucosaminyltransferase TarS [Methanosarcinales archaeon]
MISIITPILNEEGYVKPFLMHLNKVKGDFELILVDGGSKDGTLNEVENCRNEFHGKLRLLSAPRGRAIQMNKGAQVAHGDILLFLHVDCFIQKDSLELIEKEIGKGVIGGGFRQAFFDADFLLKFSSAFGNLRVSLTRTFFGDYGIFLRKDTFEKIGCYENIPFLEDVELCKKAKKCGKLVQIDRYIFTSPRRYLSHGRIKLTIVFNIACLFNIVGFRPRFLYRYIADR